MNKLVDQYNNVYYHSSNKKLINAMLFIPLWLKKFNEVNEVNETVRIKKCKNICNKGYAENLSKEIFIIDFVLKLIFRLIKLKI